MPESNAPIDVAFNGNNYRRYPDSPHLNHQRYYTKTTGKGFCTLHRDIYEYFKGPIPDGWHVHHLDEDFFNNSPDNLGCMPYAEHRAEHSDVMAAAARKSIETARLYASEWHGTEAGLAFHKKLGRESWDNREREPIGTCANCGDPIESFFKRKDDAEARYCSRKCSRAVADRAKRYTVEAKCPVCEQAFQVRKWGKRAKTCSIICGSALRWGRSPGVQPPC